MRRRWYLALAGALVVGCLKGPTSTGANDVRFALSAQVSGATSAVLHVIVSYLLDSGRVATPPLVDTRINAGTGTAQVPLTIDLGPCLVDPRRANDSPSCQLTVTVTLEQNGTVVDSVTIPTITAIPGQTVQASTSVQPIGAVHVGPTSATIAVGGTVQLVDTVFSPTNAVVTGVAVTWSSANTQVARVDTSGLVTGVGAGTTQITATAGSAQASATITVTAPVTGGLALGVPSVQFSAPNGSTIPANAIIAVTSTGTSQVSGLNATVTYGAGATGWLLANVSDSSFGAVVAKRGKGFHASVIRALIRRQTEGGPSDTTPGVLDVVPGTTTLTPGTYTATVTVTGSGGASVQLPVTYTISAAASKLVLTPNTVTFQLYGNGQILPPPDTITGSQSGLTVTGYSWIGNTTGYLNATLTGGDSLMVNPTTTNLPLQNLQAYVHVQDGNGDTASLLVNVNVTATFTQLTAGGAFSCGVTTGATVYCWGDNTHGQLGIGTTGGQYGTPQPIKLAGATIASVTAGYLHACVITTTNAVFCWGDNSRGQLGLGSLVGGTYSTPVAESSFPASQLSLGLYHTCAVGSPTVAPYGAGVACWGDNTNGQLGTGTADTVAHGSPATVGQTFVSVSVGAYHSCGVFDSNAPVVYCWGDNGDGQLAIDSTGSGYPSLHVAASGYHAVAAGGFHTCAIDANFAVHCAGDNNLGELGTGNYNTPALQFIPTVPSQQADSIYSGYFHTCALRTNVATCWGFDSAGALGIGQTTGSVTTPTAVTGGLSFASLALSTAGYHTCGLTTVGVAYCWGYNAYGQLGNASTGESGLPVQVVGQPAAPGVTPGGGARVVKRPAKPTVRRAVRN